MLARDGSLVLIDYALAHRYLDEDGNHVVKEKKRHFKGTVMYASRNSLRRMGNSRRDDLESLLYMVVRMCGVRLPW